MHGRRIFWIRIQGMNPVAILQLMPGSGTRFTANAPATFLAGNAHFHPHARRAAHCTLVCKVDMRNDGWHVLLKQHHNHVNSVGGTGEFIHRPHAVRRLLRKAQIQAQSAISWDTNGASYGHGRCRWQVERPVPAFQRINRACRLPILLGEHGHQVCCVIWVVLHPQRHLTCTPLGPHHRILSDRVQHVFCWCEDYHLCGISDLVAIPGISGLLDLLGHSCAPSGGWKMEADRGKLMTRLFFFNIIDDSSEK